MAASACGRARANQTARRAMCDATDGQCHARKGPRVTCMDDSDARRARASLLTAPTNPPTGECRAGFRPQRLRRKAAVSDRRDAASKGSARPQSFCADGPRSPTDQCFPQLTSYQVNVNASFLVTGTQAGSYARRQVRDPNGRLSPVQSRRPTATRVWCPRIPLRPYPGQDLTRSCAARRQGRVPDPAEQRRTRADGLLHRSLRSGARSRPIVDGDGKLDRLALAARSSARRRRSWSTG